MSQNAWEYTWDEICEISENPKDRAVIDYRGYLIVSRDRRLVGSHIGRAKELYRESLNYALAKGVGIDARVLEAAGLKSQYPASDSTKQSPSLFVPAESGVSLPLPDASEKDEPLLSFA